MADSPAGRPYQRGARTRPNTAVSGPGTRRTRPTVGNSPAAAIIAVNFPIASPMSSLPAQRTRSIQSFSDVQALAASDMAAVNTLIRQRLASDVVLINQIAEHIIGGGGKRLRPMLVLL